MKPRWFWDWCDFGVPTWPIGFSGHRDGAAFYLAIDVGWRRLIVGRWWRA